MLHRRKTCEFVCTSTDPVVQTVYGQLRGFRVDGVNVFRGIPYAQAKRFQMPEKPEAWSGIRDALAYGPGCPEMTFSMEDRQELDQLMVPGRIWSISENCLNLNIWTQHLDSDSRRPVMVWFHGGGFAGGSATHLYSYDGFEMAANYDVVIVTVNHRLNMLGFSDFSSFGGVYAHSGNAGMADLVAALEWIQANIAQFGGDPDNVTIYGQSGGGGKVTTLLQMPSADGLYHKAIIQSGIMSGGPGTRNQTHPSEMGKRAAAILGLTSETIEQLSVLPYNTVRDAVVQAMQELGSSPMGWSPVPQDGYYLGNPLDVGFRPETRRIPLMAGSCVAEFSGNMPVGLRSEFSDEQRMALLTAAYGEDASAARAAFEVAYPELDWRYAVAVDNNCRPATLAFLNRRSAEAEAPCYNYVFAFESPIMGGQLTGHNGDLHFMFHNASYMEGMCKPGVTERLEDDMGRAWSDFAKTGCPGWEAYTPESGASMILGEVTELRHKHDTALLEIIRKHPPKMPHFGK